LTERDLTRTAMRAASSLGQRGGAPVPYDVTAGRYDGAAGNLALIGEYRVVTPQGEVICHPVFELYRRLCQRYPPETVEAICWIPRAQLEQTARLIWQARPVSYYA
jgi:anaerobic selenocysteine-containing dehydrogenase